MKEEEGRKKGILRKKSERSRKKERITKKKEEIKNCRKEGYGRKRRMR